MAKNTKQQRSNTSLGKRVVAGSLCAVMFGMSLLGVGPLPAREANAQAPGPDSQQVSERSASRFSSRDWARANTVKEMRDYFGARNFDDNLFYRNLVDGRWLDATEFSNPQLNNQHGGKEPGTKPQEDVAGTPESRLAKAKSYQIDVFRSAIGIPLDFDSYQHPKSFERRRLTLTGGYYMDSNVGAEISQKVRENPGAALSGGVVGGVLGGLPGAALGGFVSSGAFLEVFKATEEYALWVFSSEDKPGLMQVLKCTGGGSSDPEKNRFMYIANGEDVTDVVDNKKLFEDRVKVANISRAYNSKGETEDQLWGTSRLADFLCNQAKSKKQFDEFCPDKLDKKNCPSDAKAFSLFDPLSWAIGVMRKIVGAFLTMVTDALGEVINLGNISAVDGVSQAWQAMRDLVNILFILVFVAMAFSTMLRIDLQKYSVRALLPRLIFAIIAVNYSLLFVTILTNAAFVLSQPFLAGADRAINDHNPVDSVDKLTSGVDGFGMQIILLIAALAVGVVLLILALLFIIRILVIWLLGALAPFVFLFMVLPFSRPLTILWLNELLKWVFMAPIALMVLWIGGKFLSVGDSIDNQLLSIGLFIGVVVAAVLIPLRLGGEVMQKAVGAGKFGGSKLGMAAAGRVKFGKKPTAGPDTRKSLAGSIRKAGILAGVSKPPPRGSRAGFQYEEAMKDLYGDIGEGAGLGQLASVAAGKRRAIQESVVDEAAKENTSVPIPEQIVAINSAATNGTKEVNGKMYPLDDGGNTINSPLNDVQQELLASRPRRLAAVRELAKGALLSDKAAEHFADTGYPQLNSTNPLHAAMRLDGTLDERSALSSAGNLRGDAARQIDNEFLDRVEEYTLLKNNSSLPPGRKKKVKVGDREYTSIHALPARLRTKLETAHSAFSQIDAITLQGLVAHEGRESARYLNKRAKIARMVKGGAHDKLSDDARKAVEDKFVETHSKAGAQPFISKVAEEMEAGRSGYIGDQLDRWGADK